MSTTDSLNAFAVDVDDGDKTYEKTADNSDDDDGDGNGEHGQLASERTIREEIVSQFPQDNLVHCFGYGSGVFSQSLSNDKQGVSSIAGMLDLILVVDDTREFHRANLQRFPHHYAPWLRYGGPDLATKIQRQGIPSLRDAHVLFHVVDEDEKNNLPKMKYGVVDREDLERDLTKWDSLYLAGRLHKPTLPVVANDNDLLEAQTKNLRAATAAALLLSTQPPPSTNTASTEVSWPSLYRQIAALSYTGDFRMRVGGEDPQKLDKLVQAPGQLQRFHDLYRPILKSYETSGLLSASHSSSNNGSGGLEWNSYDPSTISYLRQQLPQSLREGDTVTATSNNNCAIGHDALAKALAAIVAPAARNQSFKGIFTLGFRKSIQYASAKLSKGLLSRR
jgi:translocator assembly and maintenance protein 41